MNSILLATISFLALYLADNSKWIEQDKAFGQYIQSKLLVYDGSKREHLKKIRVSPDRSSVAAVIEADRAEYVWSENLGNSRFYDRIVHMNYSPDGDHLAFVAVDNGRACVVLDFEEIGRYDNIVHDSIIFSPDSKRYGFVTAKITNGKKEYITAVVDGKSGKRYHSIFFSEDSPAMEFGNTGKHAVYFTSDGEERFIVNNGIEGPHFDQTGWGPVFSYDDSLVAYVGLHGDQRYLVVDDSIYGPYPDLDFLVFSPTSYDLAYRIKYKDSSRIFLNHRIYGEGYKYCASPVFSPNGERFAFWASDGKRPFAIVDSSKDMQYFSISAPRFTADNLHYWYDVSYDDSFKKRSFVVDGTLLPEMRGIFDHLFLSFSPDGSQTAYSWRVSESDMRTVVDGKEFSGYFWTDPVTFSPDNKRYAFRSMGKKKAVMVIDGKEQKDYKSIGINVAFSSDSKDVAYYASKGKKNKRLVINETEFEKFDYTFPRKVRYEEDGSVVFYAVKKGRKIYRLAVKRVEE